MAETNATHWIGFDLGGSKMLATVYDEKLEPKGSKRKKTKAHLGAEAGLGRIRETIQAALSDAGVDADELAGIGVGCPGPLDLEEGVILDTPNMGWKNVEMRAFLEDAFGCPAVIANDVDAGVYGEYVAGAGRGARCLVGLFPGTGIGGGCVYEGRILRGKRQSCLEIGHMPLIPNGPLAGNGLKGTLESVASRLAIASAAAAAAHRGQAPALLEKTGTDIMDIRSGALASSIAGGDEAVEEIVRQAARWIGCATAGVIQLLAPDVVVLGGGLVEAMPDLFREEVDAGIQAHLMHTFRGTFVIKVAELGDDAAVMGAAAYARQQFSGDADG